jgi:hypothetical protein
MRWEISIASGNGSWVVRRHLAGPPRSQFARLHDPVRDGGTVVVGGIGSRIIRSATDPDRARPGAYIRSASIDYINQVHMEDELAAVLPHSCIGLAIGFQKYSFNTRSLPLGHIFALVISFERLDELVALPCRVNGGRRTVPKGRDAQPNRLRFILGKRKRS